MEANLRHFFTLVADQLGADVRDLPGGGAAGAFSAGLKAFLGADLASGIDLVLDALHFEERLSGIDLVITGEGRMDAQTLGGKGPFGLAVAARARGIPTVAIVGGLGDGEAALLQTLAAVDPDRAGADHAGRVAGGCGRIAGKGRRARRAPDRPGQNAS